MFISLLSLGKFSQTYSPTLITATKLANCFMKKKMQKEKTPHARRKHNNYGESAKESKIKPRKILQLRQVYLLKQSTRKTNYINHVTDETICALRATLLHVSNINCNIMASCKTRSLESVRSIHFPSANLRTVRNCLLNLHK